MAADSRQDEDLSVRHLIELGYTDPAEVDARRAALRRRLDDDLRRAIELLRSSRQSDATRLLDRLIKEDPDWIAPRQLLADIHFRAGDWKAAQSNLDWLAHHNVVTPRLALMSATLAVQRRALRCALEDLEYACHVDPALGGARSLLGTVRMRLGLWETAEETFKQAHAQNSTDARALDGLSAVALRRGDFEEAAHRALEALEHDMRLYPAHYHLGIALVRLGRAEAAGEAFLTCARLDPSRAAPFYWMSRIARERQNEIAAAEYRNHGLEILRRRRQRRAPEPPPAPSSGSRT